MTQNLLCSDLVHTGGASLYRRARIGNPRKLQQSLNTSVLPSLSVKSKKNKIGSKRQQLPSGISPQIKQ